MQYRQRPRSNASRWRKSSDVAADACCFSIRNVAMRSDGDPTYGALPTADSHGVR